MATNEETHVNHGQYNYQNNFEQMCEIGKGGYGKVYKVKDRLDDHIYAIKIIELEKLENGFIEKILREPKTMAQLNGDKVVRYMNTWIEESRLFIKMEYCTGNLQTLIRNKPFYFDREDSEPLNVLEYYISCNIFEDILKAVEYLHESIPPVIHRDLKPENILISKNSNNRQCLKIADFGLAVFHEKTSMRHSSNMGTLTYMAPEVFRNDYDTKADVYSLGRIAEELFQVDTNKSQQKFRPHLAEKYYNLTEVILSMVSRPFERPTCAEVLGNIGNFQLTTQRVKEYERFETMRKSLMEYVEEDSIILEYLSKLDEHEQIFPKFIGTLVNVFQNMAVKQELAIADNDQGAVVEQDNENMDLVEALKEPIAKLFKPNNGLFATLNHFSKLDEQVHMFPSNIGGFLKKFQNNGDKRQMAIDESDQVKIDEDKSGEDQEQKEINVEALKDPITSLFNPKNEVVKHFLTFLDQVRDLPENIEKAQERFRNKK